MTGPELARCLETLGWGRLTLAKRIGCSETLIRRMEAGTRKIEPELARWLQAATTWMERHPPPVTHGLPHQKSAK